MFSCMRVSAAMFALAIAAGNARALRPEEVLVVANANSTDSVTLAKFYAQARGISQRNIVLIKTTTAYEVSRTGYETQIRRPIGQFLIENQLINKVRCVVLMWGVPVRVRGGFAQGGNETILQAYKAAATRAHYRLAIDYKLLSTVGKKFPSPQTAGLELKPIGKLFATEIPEPAKPLTELEALREDMNLLLAAKANQIRKIADPAKQQIASQQLMALHLDIGGLEGLIAHIEETQPPGAPDPQDLKHQLAKAETRLEQLRRKAGATIEDVKAKLALLEQTGGILLVCSRAYEQAQINALYWREAPALKGKKIPPVLMTARIDGPTPADAIRIINTSIAAERDGLDGVFYIDAGVPRGFSQAKNSSGYRQFDNRLKKLYAFLEAKTKLEVVIDKKETLFPEGSCPDAALYVGWYSLRKYVPAFTWRPGAVGWHTASWEAMHLRDPNTTEWCAKMIQNGVAATIGGVAEPTLGAFPPPEEFFGLLLTGKWTVVQCYWRTVPWASWRMTLIADPLYNPFATRPQLSVEALPAGLAP